jgi:hypothetical protein
MSGILGMKAGGLSDLIGSLDKLSSALKVAFPQAALMNAASNLLQNAIGDSLKQAVTQMMQKNDMPKFIGKAIKEAVNKAVSDLMKPSEQGATDSVQKDLESSLTDFKSMMMKNIIDDAIAQMKKAGKKKGGGESGGEAGAAGGAAGAAAGGGATGGTEGASAAGGTESAGGASSSGGGDGASWFEAIANALGNALNKQADKIKALSSQITDANASDKPKTMTDLNAASQKMAFMTQSATEVIQTIGKALKEGVGQPA